MTDKRNPPSIHKAEASDAAMIVRLAQQLAAHEGQDTLCDERAILRVMQNKQSPECQFYVAKTNNEIVGFALVYAGYDLSSDSYGYHLADIAVDDAYRRKGIATHLLRFIAQEMKDEGREWLSLTVLRDNAQANAFYDALNFVEIDVCFLAAGKTILRAI